jgi:ornithine cyclodeaminase/alanine dehydrogenase
MTSDAPADTLTYLDRTAVRRLLPSREEQMDRIAEVYVAMSEGRVENPPKMGVHPRPDAFLHAMPAYLEDGDVTALKWVGAYPANTAAGLPAITGLIVLNDSATGLPLAVMDATEITAVRTAAASGVSIRHLAHPGWDRVAILGYGEQGRQHVEVVRTLAPDATITVYAGPRPRDPGPGVDLAADARTAVEGADVVVTAGPMTRDDSRRLEREWLPERCLVVPVDFDAYVTTDLAERADSFVVDDIAQFEHHRSLGRFRGWPEPESSLGAALQAPARGDLRVSCSLGVGALDAALAKAVWERARAEGVGVPLQR